MAIITQLIQTAIKMGAHSADSISFSNSGITATTRMGKLENIERSESCGFGLRVIIDKKQAIVSSTDITSSTLDELATRAIAMARLAPQDQYIGLAEENILCRIPPELDLLDTNEPSAEELFARAEKAEAAALKIHGVTNSEGAEASYGCSIVTIATSEGFTGEYKTSMSAISASILAGSGTGMERDYDFSSARHATDLASPAEIGISAAEKAIKRLNPRRIKTCTVPVIFDPRTAKSIIGTLSSAINGAAVARGSTFLKDNMGKRLFKPGINITNDPHIKRGLVSRPYDAEGVKNSKLAIVDDGILQNWLLDIRSANQLGLVTNGCASRGLASPPSPSCNNLYMENGTESAQNLIAGIKSGFYVTETFGMGINILTGDYSQGASGFWIENGEIAYPVNEITIAGTLPEMFMQLTPANDLTFRYSTNSPTLLIEKMTVAGL